MYGASKLAPKRSRTTTKHNKLLYTGEDLARRLSGLEKLPLTVLGDYLGLGNSTKLKQGKDRTHLKKFAKMLGKETKEDDDEKTESIVSHSTRLHQMCITLFD